MKNWKMTSDAGVDMGVYPGETREEAIAAMARDAGYADAAEAAAVGPWTGTAEEMKEKYSEIEERATQAAREAVDAEMEGIEARYDAARDAAMEIEDEECRLDALVAAGADRDDAIRDAVQDAEASASDNLGEDVTGFWDSEDPIQFRADRQFTIRGVVVSVSGEDIHRDNEEAVYDLLQAAGRALGLDEAAVERVWDALDRDEVEAALDDPEAVLRAAEAAK